MPGKVVVDANVVISSLINKVICFSALASNAVLKKVELMAPHFKDVPYVALALATDAPILSGDKGLRNSKVKVISPREFLEKLLKY